MNTTEAADVVRKFLRANQKADGAMEASEALRELEDAALDARGSRDRELAYSKAIVDAQRDIRSAVKDTKVDLIVAGTSKGKYDVAATEQLIVLCREVNATHGLAIEADSSEVVVVGEYPFVRTTYGIRHRDGFVRTFKRDFPLKDSSDIAWRKSMTSNLGYTIRDVYALPRLKDEGEGGATSGPRSGPRKAQGRGAEASTPAVSSGQSDGRPSNEQAAVNPAPPKKPPTVAELEAMVTKAGHDALDKLCLKLDDVDYTHEMGAPGAYSKDEVAQLRAAVKKRREELSK